MHLGTFTHDHSLDLTGPTIERTAVRGVLFRGDQLLLLSSRHGDYKFPGGGVEPAETLQAALHREFAEECGLPDVTVGKLLGDTVEYMRAAQAEYEVFKMTSHYFTCASQATPTEPQQLEDYEAELELRPCWVTVEDALQANRAVLASGVGVMRWLVRETEVLELLS
ncbi:NUDIX domain-containing protein [Streptomyces sp. SID13031]|uniref:NUDIX domain-containing protein n=1 Tax=Streptomyces sp. SID13031 TaxID=2706046 RepID=UPI0013C6BD62|nr:NUDIX domain-containing protein [Streptomyces sp. SID13031]NEA37113.1 NUDIX domain-containing protein [Streptomyces sp. SID13031]